MSAISKKIDAVEQLLGSYYGNPSPDERNLRLRESLSKTKNEYIKSYAQFTYINLEAQLDFLQKQVASEWLIEC